jgi:hypothetical protein
MLFKDYRSNFEARLAALTFPLGTTQEGIGCETKVNPLMPPWVMDWAILYPDGLHIRVKETYRPKPHPLYNQGQRLHFCFQYGMTTMRDAKGMPRTASSSDTIIRIDHDRFGAHMHYGGRDHIKQEGLTGKFVIDDIEVFEFIEAVETSRLSGCAMEDILFFALKKEGRR